MAAAFSIEEAVGYAWKTVKQHWMTLIPVMLGLALIGQIVQAIVRPDENPNKLADWMHWDWNAFVSNMAGNLLVTTVSVILGAIAIKVALQYVDGKVSDFSSLFRGITPELLVKVIAASLLLNIVVVVGLLLLVIPGIYLFLRYSQAVYVLVDRDTGILEAFKESAELMEGAKLQYILFGIVCTLLIILGIVALLVGVIVALPVVYVAAAHVYRQLSKRAASRTKAA